MYCSAFPRGLLENKLSESKRAHTPKFHDFSLDKTVKIGPFEVTPTAVRHSTIEAVGLGIQTPVGFLVHSGDFKHDPVEYKGQTVDLGQFEAWGKKNPLVLFGDSTNAERLGHSHGEMEIAKSFEKLLAQQDRRLIITLFASNMWRIENILRIAATQKKKVALIGRSLHGCTQLAFEQGSLDIPENTLILAENAGDYPDEQVVVLATGSQAEPHSALVRMAHGNLKEFKLKPKDQVIFSSRFIPGNERSISELMNQIYRAGADVLFESPLPVHVSGHGYSEDLMLLHKAVQPKFFVPVHGEYRHMAKHGQLAERSGIAKKNIFIIENGQMLETDGTTLKLGPHFDSRKVAVVGGELMDPTPTVFKERSGGAKAGVLFSVIFRDSKNQKLLGPPVVSGYGLMFKEGESETQVRAEAVELVEQFAEKNARNPELEDQIRMQLRRYYKDKTVYKPITLSKVIDV